MKIDDYLKNKISFAVVINLLKTKNKNFVVFKPYINIQSAKEEHINDYIHFLKIKNTKVRKSKDAKGLEIYQLPIQNFEDIDSVIFNLKNQEFLFPEKNQAFEKFKKVFIQIKKMDKSYSEWDDVFLDVIKAKVEINHGKRTYLTAKQWVSKIKEHFKG